MEHWRTPRGLWKVALLVGVVVALMTLGFLVLFRGADTIPGQITPAGAVVQLRDDVEAGDYEGARTRLCGDIGDSAAAEPAPADEVVAFFQDHDVELADPRDHGEIPSSRDLDERVSATVAITARRGRDADVSSQRWIAHLQRDPGVSQGPMMRRSLRWRVCGIEPDTNLRQ
jgi:hypothetical protein